MKKFSKYLFVIGATIVAISSVPTLVLAAVLFTIWAIISSIITAATVVELMTLFALECKRTFKNAIKEITKIIK